MTAYDEYRARRDAARALAARLEATRRPDSFQAEIDAARAESTALASKSAARHARHAKGAA